MASEWRYDHILASTWHPRSWRNDARTLAAVQCLFHAGLALELAQWDMRARQANILTILQRQRKPRQLPGVVPCKVAVGLALIGLGLTCTPKWSLRPAATSKPCVTALVHTGSLCSGQARDLQARKRTWHRRELRGRVPQTTSCAAKMRTTRPLFSGTMIFATKWSIKPWPLCPQGGKQTHRRAGGSPAIVKPLSRSRGGYHQFFHRCWRL